MKEVNEQIRKAKRNKRNIERCSKIEKKLKYLNNIRFFLVLMGLIIMVAIMTTTINMTSILAESDVGGQLTVLLSFVFVFVCFSASIIYLIRKENEKETIMEGIKERHNIQNIFKGVEEKNVDNYIKELNLMSKKEKISIENN